MSQFQQRDLDRLAQALRGRTHGLGALEHVSMARQVIEQCAPLLQADGLNIKARCTIEAALDVMRESCLALLDKPERDEPPECQTIST